MRAKKPFNTASKTTRKHVVLTQEESAFISFIRAHSADTSDTQVIRDALKFYKHFLEITKDTQNYFFAARNDNTVVRFKRDSFVLYNRGEKTTRRHVALAGEDLKILQDIKEAFGLGYGHAAGRALKLYAAIWSEVGLDSAIHSMQPKQPTPLAVYPFLNLAA